MSPAERMQALLDRFSIGGEEASAILSVLDDEVETAYHEGREETGMTLTREEAGLAATWAAMTVQAFGPHPTPQGAAFAARLDAAWRKKAQ